MSQGDGLGAAIFAQSHYLLTRIFFKFYCWTDTLVDTESLRMLLGFKGMGPSDRGVRMGRLSDVDTNPFQSKELPEKR